MKIIRVILLIINIVLALGLLATTLAGSVAPSSSILPSICAFAFLPFFAANIVMVVVWLLMKRWECILSIAVIVFRWSMVGLFFQIGGTTKTPDVEEHPRMVSLISYNLHLFQGRCDRASQSDTNALLFLDMLRCYNPDVLCLQEFAAPKTVSVVDSLMRMGYNHYYGAHTSREKFPYGTVVFSRLPITYVNRIDDDKILVELLHDSDRFRVCCIHMDSYRFDDADREQLELIRHGEMDSSSRRTLGKVKETILSHETEWNERIYPVVSECTMPLLLAGDLNDIPSSWLYHQITRQMSDTFRECGMGFGSTYNGGFPQFRIDMVFHNDGFRTLSHKRICSTLSDHHAVFTTLEFEP